METNIIEGFQKCIEQCVVKYNKFIGNGDSLVRETQQTWKTGDNRQAGDTGHVGDT